MRKSFKIILDVDDVLLECNQYALITLNHAYGYDYGLDDITGIIVYDERQVTLQYLIELEK